MNRSEIAVTVLGLIATFLMPWPGGESPMQAGHAVHTEVNSVSCTTGPTPAVPSDTRASRVRAASERASDRG
jgi:hypothetical protein